MIWLADKEFHKRQAIQHALSLALSLLELRAVAPWRVASDYSSVE